MGYNRTHYDVKEDRRRKSNEKTKSKGKSLNDWYNDGENSDMLDEFKRVMKKPNKSTKR